LDHILKHLEQNQLTPFEPNCHISEEVS